MFAFVAWVLVPADVIPRPSIEATFLNVRDVVRREIVADFVALVHRAPQLSRFGMDRFADTIANSPGIDAEAAAVRIEFEHVGAVIFDGIVVSVIDVRVRANRDEHLLAIGREDDVARPVAAAAQVSAARQIGDLLLWPACLHVAILVREANDRIGVADVHPLRIRPGRIEVDAEWFAQSCGKHLRSLRLAILANAAEDLYVAGIALSQEQERSSAALARMAS